MRHFEEYNKELQDDLEYCGKVYMITFMIMWLSEECFDTYEYQGHTEKYFQEVEIQYIHDLESGEEIHDQDIINHFKELLTTEHENYIEQ